MKSLLFLIVSMIATQIYAEETKRSKNELIKTHIKKMNLEEFHNYHVDEFSKAPGFGESRIQIMPKVVQLSLEGEDYFMVNMRLLSVTDRKKAVLWEMEPVNGNIVFWGALDRTMLENKHMKKRPLNEVESSALADLKKNRKSVVKRTGGALKVIAALNAQSACVRCHEDYTKGEFMGAFVYDLMKMSQLNKQGKQNKKASLALSEEFSSQSK